jgi:hypothetical protein
MKGNEKFRMMKMQAQKMQNMGAIAPNVLPGVKPNDLVEIICTNCGGEVFVPAHLLRFASRFQSKNAQPTLVQFPLGFMCVTCNQINPFDVEKLTGQKTTDQDGQKQVSKEDTTDDGSLGISVNDGVKSKESLS